MTGTVTTLADRFGYFDVRLEPSRSRVEDKCCINADLEAGCSTNLPLTTFDVGYKVIFQAPPVG